mmetsp:Transcript_12531/g.20968  ORF Transcript_12531/g.20968 Transcript_12531/m.20968 type:complete len:739 (-) Transcript_12531:1615-3831(-)
MFYSEVILARKGPLGKIWLAAHFDKKLSKNQIFSTDISSSVESVLNPSTPLALRVSGHLMLGIVRIYSRKVTYLMTDCTEAMWKIKLAFRPGNVDIDPNVATGLNIDDARHFGNVAADNEFPDLENTAFPQFLLSGYDQSLADRNSLDQGNASYSLNDYQLSAESPLQVGRSSIDLNLGSRSSSKRSRVSEIELMRDERSRSLLSNQQQRASLSSVHGGRPSGMSGMNFEDDVIPAFEDNAFEGGNAFGDFDTGVLEVTAGEDAQFMEFDNSADTVGPSFDGHPEEEVKESSPTEPSQIMGEGNKEQDEDEDGEEQDEVEQQREEYQPGGDDTAVGSSGATKVKRRTKRRRVQIDDRVELPNRLIKQRMADLGPILRRKDNALLPFQVTENDHAEDEEGASAAGHSSNHLPTAKEDSMEDRLNVPASVRALCPELREIFSMATNTAPLPFPFKDSEGHHRLSSGDSSVAIGASNMGAGGGGGAGAGAGGVEAIEMTRAPRDSEVDVAGRASLLNASSASSHYSSAYGDDAAGMSYLTADDNATDGGGLLSRYSADAVAHRMSQDGGYEFEAAEPEQDYPEMIPTAEEENHAGEGLMRFGDSPNDHNSSGGMEEYKAGDFGSHHRGYNSEAALPMNSVSEMVAQAFSVSPSDASSSSTSSHKKKSRTSVFMNILENEFENKDNAAVSFDGLSSGVSRRVAATCFLEVLQLKTWGRIQVHQDAPFADIQIQPAAVAVAAV